MSSFHLILYITGISCATKLQKNHYNTTKTACFFTHLLPFCTGYNQCANVPSTTGKCKKFRTATIEWARMTGERPKLSVFLQDKLLKDYSTLSKVFREDRGMTIERYSILQRIERVKELLCYSERSTGELAWETGYSSPAHLSTQFKQVTGMSPTQYRESGEGHPAPDRRFLDEI